MDHSMVLTGQSKLSMTLGLSTDMLCLGGSRNWHAAGSKLIQKHAATDCKFYCTLKSATLHKPST